MIVYFTIGLGLILIILSLEGINLFRTKWANSKDFAIGNYPVRNGILLQFFIGLFMSVPSIISIMDNIN